MPRYFHETARKLVRRILDRELLLPNIQRTLVWEPEQILFLLDSLLRGYPVSTMLFWRTTSRIRARRFIDRFRDGLRFSDYEYELGPNGGAHQFVLDGQQRLQALTIALAGSYNDEIVHLDLLGRPENDELRYAFLFRRPDDPRLPKTAVPLSELVMSEESSTRLARRVIALLRERGVALSQDAEESAAELIGDTHQAFAVSEAITYFQADEQENPNFRKLDEVLEIFIRINSGGTKLDWSDLLFSVVKSRWPDALATFEAFLAEINRNDAFAFDKDDLLKLCLILTDQGAKYESSLSTWHTSRAASSLRPSRPFPAETAQRSTTSSPRSSSGGFTRERGARRTTERSTTPGTTAWLSVMRTAASPISTRTSTTMKRRKDASGDSISSPRRSGSTRA